MPLHAGPPDVFKVIEEGGYAKIICVMCSAIAQLTHCRCKQHQTKLAERYAKDKKLHMPWAN
eukprot:774577-Lingulodinium_polyedra.AAC.1